MFLALAVIVIVPAMFLALLVVCRGFAQHSQMPEPYEQRLWAKYALAAETKKAA